MDINSTRARLAIILACGLIPAALLTFRDRPIEAGGIRIPTVRSALGDIGVLPTLEPLTPLEVAGATPVPSGSLDPSVAEGAVAEAGSSGPVATPAPTPREVVPAGPVPREPDAGLPSEQPATTVPGQTPVPGSGTPGANPTPSPAPLPGASPTPTPAPLPGASPTPGATPGPTPAPTPAPLPDPTPQPTPEPTPAPLPDPTPEPTVEILPTLEPLPTLLPPPTLEPIL